MRLLSLGALVVLACMHGSAVADEPVCALPAEYEGRSLACGPSELFLQYAQGCFQQVPSDTGFYANPGENRAGIRFLKCTQAGGCSCMRARVCPGGSGDCMGIYGCSSPEGSKKCFSVVPCDLNALSHTTSIHFRIPDGKPALDQLASASRDAFLANLHADLKICTKACLVQRPVVKGPTTVEVSSSSPMDNRFRQCVRDTKINVRHIGVNYLGIAVGPGASVSTPFDSNNGSDGISFGLSVLSETTLVGIDTIVAGADLTCSLYVRNGGVRHNPASRPRVSVENGWSLVAQRNNLNPDTFVYPIFRGLNIILQPGNYGVYINCPSAMNYRDFEEGESEGTFTSGGVTIDVTPTNGFGGSTELEFTPRMFRGTLYFVETIVQG